MVQQPLYLQFPVRPKREYSMLEGLNNFLNSNKLRLALILFCRQVLRRYDDSIRTLSNGIDDLVPFVYLKLGVDNHIGMIVPGIATLIIGQLRHLGLLLFWLITVCCTLHICCLLCCLKKYN